MGDLTIGDKLLDSCKDLFTMGVLSKAQYSKCVENIAGSDTRRQIQITEENIFSGSRDDKEGKYNEFIASVKRVIDESFQKYESAATDTEKNKYEAIIIQIIILINNVIDWVQNVSLKRHKTKEDGHYGELLFYYNKIDNGRKEIEKVNKQMLTLTERDVFQGDRNTKKMRKHTKSTNILISLIVFIIISGVIIFLIYFI
jgi:hypothetical protein